MPETRAAPRKPVKGPQRRAIGGSALIVVCDPVKHTYGTNQQANLEDRRRRGRRRARTRGVGDRRCCLFSSSHVRDQVSQVKSSQVQISMAAAPAAFGAPAGARDREGAARRNRHGSPEPGLYPHFLFVFILIRDLDHRGAPVFLHQLRAIFRKTVRQC